MDHEYVLGEYVFVVTNEHTRLYKYYFFYFVQYFMSNFTFEESEQPTILSPKTSIYLFNPNLSRNPHVVFIICNLSSYIITACVIVTLGYRLQAKETQKCRIMFVSRI